MQDAEGIDIPRPLVLDAAPYSETLCRDPLVVVHHRALTAFECAHVIDCARDKLKVAGVAYDHGVGMHEGRTAHHGWLPHHHDTVVAKVCRKLAEHAGLPLTHAEHMQVVRYRDGGEYRPHFDAFNLETSRGDAYTTTRGQRIATVLVYLNTVRHGGETIFPKLALSFTPVQGSILVFENLIKGTRKVHPLSFHGSTPVKSGEKWIANLWFREHAMREA